MTAPYRAGDTITVHCLTTELADTIATVTAWRVDKLGCGCQRLMCRRPGPNTGHFRDMHILTGCGLHESGILPAGTDHSAAPA